VFINQEILRNKVINQAKKEMKIALVLSVAFTLLSATLFFSNVGVNLFGYMENFVLSYGSLGLSGISFLGYVEFKHKQYGQN